LVKGIEDLLSGLPGSALLDLYQLHQLAIPGTPAGAAASAAAAAAGAGNAPIGGTIHVKVSGGTASVQANSTNSRVPIVVAPGNRGRVVGRP